jgi:hypothetical protein
MIILISYLFLLILIIIIGKNYETFFPPWDLQKCRLACIKAGQEIPWLGGSSGSWNNPANNPRSNFDVSGCISKCDLSTWYDFPI